jgi:hypothetical protein
MSRIYYSPYKCYTNNGKPNPFAREPRVTLIGAIVNSTHMYRNSFKKTVILNQNTNAFEYKCIAVESYIQLIDSEIMRIVLKICPLLVDKE